MLLAALALQLSQQTFAGAGFAVTYFAETMVPQEITTEDAYIFQLLDPADPLALCPPLRVTTYLDTEKLGAPLDLATHTNRRTVDALEARGLTPNGFSSFGMSILNEYDYVSYFQCAHEDGSEWYYLIRGQRIDDHLMVVTACRPTDKDSSRYANVQLALESLKWLGIDESKHIAYDLGGIRFPVPIHFNAVVGGSATHAELSAVGDEETAIAVKASYRSSPAKAATDAKSLREALPDQLMKSKRASGRSYSVQSVNPALFAIGERTVRGWRSHVKVEPGLYGWRHDAVFSVANLVVEVTTVARGSNYWRSLHRFERLLERVPAEHIPGQQRTTIRDGLLFRYDAELELVCSGEAPLARYEFRRKGLDPASFGKVWVEIRDDLDTSEREDYVATRFRNTLYGERQAGSADWVRQTWLGSAVRGVEATFIGNDYKDVSAHHVMTSYAKPFGSHTILASFRGIRGESPELRGLLQQVMLGMEDVREGTATYRDAGVEYTVDSKLWRVEGNGQSSTATLRQNTVSTSWTPLSGGLFGPPPALADALKKKLESDNLSRALVGEVEEPQWGDGEFAGGIPAKTAVMVYTNGEGVKRFAIYMVMDTETRRLWVIADGLFDDAAANESMSAIIPTIVPK